MDSSEWPSHQACPSSLLIRNYCIENTIVPKARVATVPHAIKQCNLPIGVSG